MKDFSLSLKVAAVFIGTVVGAGLASGQEIIQFFTYYGPKGFLGIVLCGILYIATGLITVDLSYKYRTKSYEDLIYLSCGKHLGKAIDGLTTLFLFGGTCIILAGSGAILNQFFGLPYIVGVLLMAVSTGIAVINSTGGLVFVNSFIVPCMIGIIIIISAATFWGSYILGNNIPYLLFHGPTQKTHWLTASLLYLSFNMLFATGVLSPMTEDIKRSKGVFWGIILGSLGLFFLTLIINSVLVLKMPEASKFPIPMLYAAKSLGFAVEIALSGVIWLEMFSTEVSHAYSLGKKICQNYPISYEASVILLLAACIPFSMIRFENLIKLLYPPFGVISLIYIICLLRLYHKTLARKKL